MLIPFFLLSGKLDNLVNYVLFCAAFETGRLLIFFFDDFATETLNVRNRNVNALPQGEEL